MSNIEKTLSDLLEDPSFCRWVRGKASPIEQERWEEWKSKNTLHKEIKKKAQKLYDLPFDEVPTVDTEMVLDKLQTRIADQSKVSQLEDKANRSRFGYFGAVAAAVILLIALVSVITVTNQEPLNEETTSLFSTIEVGYGEKGALKISDGSLIKLNANSSLKYNPEHFNRSIVEVWLKGEAYFSIVRDPEGQKRSFIVHTPDGDIRILGTRFNVNTRFNRTGVVLEEGSIEILLKDSANGVSGRFKLKPGQRAQFSANRPNVQVQEVDTLLYTAWLDGKFKFNDTPFNKLVRDIEHIYGVTIQVEDPALLKERITGTLRNPDLKTLLDGLEAILHVDILKEKEGKFLIKQRDKKATKTNQDQ